jgi:uncharacterized protein YdhG (YjbR/CyaY superfamily)
MAQEGFSTDERAAMKERAKELKAASRRTSAAEKAKADAADVLEKIAALPEGDRDLAEAVHAIVAKHAPALAPKTWYGMPAYARDGKIVCFFKGASKFKVRYSEVGFNEAAQLDDGDLWPTAYAVTAMTPVVEARLAELIVRAAG